MNEIQQKYNRKKLELAITKAKTNKEDYELRILERELDIERIKNEVVKQEEQILKCELDLKEFNNPPKEK